MVKKKSSRTILIVIVVIGVILFLTLKTPIGSTIEESYKPNFKWISTGNKQPAGVSTPLAMKPYFANNEQVEIGGDVFSVIGLSTTGGTPGVYWIRFDIGATNTGNINVIVSVIDAKIKDNNGVILPETNNLLTSLANSNVLNDRRTLSPGQNYNWNTSPDTYGSIVWIPTTNLENKTQPIRFESTLKIEYTKSGIKFDSQKTVYTNLYILPDAPDTVSVEGTISSGVNETIILCNTGEIANCRLQEGVCNGINQTCTEGVWPGCSTDDYVSYSTNYNDGTEFTNDLALCQDGLDNDCDGLVDLADDCPNCMVSFRGNKITYSQSTDTLGDWISIPIIIPNSAYTTSPAFSKPLDGYASQRLSSSTNDCGTTTQCNPSGGTALPCIITTTQSGQKIIVRGTKNNVYLCYDNSHALVFSRTITSYGGCFPGNSVYPACTNIYETTGFEGQETCGAYY